MAYLIEDYDVWTGLGCAHELTLNSHCDRCETINMGRVGTKRGGDSNPIMAALYGLHHLSL